MANSVYNESSFLASERNDWVFVWGGKASGVCPAVMELGPLYGGTPHPRVNRMEGHEGRVTSQDAQRGLTTEFKSD